MRTNHKGKTNKEITFILNSKRQKLHMGSLVVLIGIINAFSNTIN